MGEIRELKMRLFSNGMDVDGEAREALTGQGERPMTLAEYATTSGVILRLEGNVYVNAPILEDFTEDATLELTYDGDGFRLVDKKASYPADPVPVPEYVFHETDDGYPYRDLGIVHTDRIRISPVAGCSYRCKFCDLPYQLDYRTKEVDHLVEVVEAAADDPVLPAHHVTVSGGTPKTDHEDYLDECVTTVAEDVDHPVDVMMCPRPEPGYLREYRAAGVDGLFLNMELWGQDRSEDLMPQKAHLMKPHFLDSVETAVEIFGAPKVRSLVILGLEPLEDTLDGVEALASRGVVPVLSPFRPSPDTPLADHPPPDVATMREAYRRTLDVCEDHGLKPGPPCIPCHHNTLTFPDGSSYYVAHGDESSGPRRWGPEAGGITDAPENQ